MSAPQPKPFPSLWQALLLIFLLMAGQVVVGSMLPETLPLWLRAGVGNLIAFAVVLWAAARVGALSWNQIAPLRAVPGALLVAVVPLAAGLGILLSEVDNVFRTFVPAPRELLEQFVSLGSDNPLGALFALVVVAPLTEELFFRGLILRAFLRRYSVATALVLSALLFALGHANPWQSMSAAAGGLLLGYLYWQTGSLVPCFLAHASFNCLSVVANLLPPISGFSGDPLGPIEYQPLWLNGLGLLLVIVGWLAVRRFGPPSPVTDASAD